MTDKFQQRLDSADNYIEGVTRLDELVVDRITITAREDKEAITFIAETDTTYPMIRWLNRAGQFLFGLVAHEKKWANAERTQKYVDKHFSMYRANADMETRTGFFDAEFGEENPMLKIEGTQVRLANYNAEDSSTPIVVESPNGSKWFLTVDNDGDVKALPATGLRSDSVLEE